MPTLPSREPIMITGGGGFIGLHLARALASAGCRPLLVTRSRPAAPTGLAPVGDQVGCVAADIRDTQAVEQALAQHRPATLFHLAGLRRQDQGAASVAACAEVNVGATTRLLESCMRYGVQRIVMMGTADEYGVQPGPVSEDAPLRPVGAYAVTKAAAAELAQLMHAKHGCPVVILRPFTVYGPGQPNDMFVADAVSCAVENRPFAMTHGAQQRDLLYVSDLVRACLAAVTAPDIEGKVINIGSGQARTLKDVASLIWHLSGTEAALLIGARPLLQWHDTWADVSRAKSLLGWEAHVELEAGLSETIAWARTQRPVQAGTPATV